MCLPFDAVFGWEQKLDNGYTWMPENRQSGGMCAVSYILFYLEHDVLFEDSLIFSLCVHCLQNPLLCVDIISLRTKFIGIQACLTIKSTWKYYLSCFAGGRV